MNKKKIITIVLSTLLIVGICGVGIWVYGKSSSGSKVVEVMPVSNIYTNWYGDETYSNGMISSSYIQEIYVQGTESVKEVFVKEGDNVAIGDKLMSYDTTLVELDLSEEKLRVQQSDMKIKEIKDNIQELKNTKPIVKKTAMTMKDKNNEFEIVKLSNEDNKVEVYSIIDPSSKPYKGDGSKENPFRFICTKDATITGGFMNQLMGYDAKGEKKVNDPLTAVFEVYKDNDKEGTLQFLWTVDGSEYKPVKEASKWSLKFISGESNEKPEDPDDGKPEEPPVEEGYTKEELAKMIATKEEELSNEELNKKEILLNITKLESKLDKSVITATVNGVVKTINNSEDKESGKPFMTVSGGKGFYVTGNISELQLNSLKIGDSVTAQTWSETGAMTYNATITEISQYPVTNNNYYGGGNTNVSYYPFTAVIEEEEGLVNGQYVDIMMNLNGGGDTEAIYISKSYIREENGQSYVYIADENNKLKKSYVETGKIIYGEMLEIKSGLTLEDRIAFPYGKYVKEGTNVKDQSNDFIMK